jgi:nucleotide-binding universal stress UspA family protein/RimJ/RimL family protein N-acetyltransferase
VSGGSEHSTVSLRDGSSATLRPIAPDDKKRLSEVFEGLSDESRYRRFFTAISELSAADLAYLTEVDHHDHEAIIAIEPSTGDALGVARYIRSATEPHAAEAAVAVVDDWHGRGLGGALLDRLADRAREEDVHRFTARVLAGNPKAMRVLEGLGESERTADGSEVELRVDLPRSGSGPQLRRALREAAAGSLVLSGVLLYRVAQAARRPRARARAELARGRGFSTIVVGTDGSVTAQRALREALELAERLRSRLHVVSAYSPVPPAMLPEKPAALPDSLSQLQWAITPQQAADAALKDAADAAKGHGIALVTHARPGEPADALIAVAEEESADLLIVGSKGMNDRRRFLLGSVPDKLSHHAPCSVLIVRTT